MVLNEIIVIATQFNVDRILLYGCRARGDHLPLSDYDIANFGEHLSDADKVLLSHAIDDINTLKKIDIVFMTSKRDDGFARQIVEEWVSIYEQAQNKRNYQDALQRPKEAIAEFAQVNSSDVVSDGLIQRFEFTYELAWKTLEIIW